jgi:hypothetical protein
MKHLWWFQIGRDKRITRGTSRAQSARRGHKNGHNRLRLSLRPRLSC